MRTVGWEVRCWAGGEGGVGPKREEVGLEGGGKEEMIGR